MENRKVAVVSMKPELHVISTGRQSFAELAGIAAAIHPYVTAIHLRETARSARELYEGIERLLAAGVPAQRLVVNDRVDVAAAAGVLGVQLGYRSLPAAQVRKRFPQLRIGVSVHSEEEALQAEADGADYVVYGHIYATPSKSDVPPRGVEALSRLAKCVPGLPVIAIGGILPSRVPELLRAGASGVAVMSGVLEALDPLGQAKAYAHYLHGGRDRT